MFWRVGVGCKVANSPFVCIELFCINLLPLELNRSFSVVTSCSCLSMPEYSCNNIILKLWNATWIKKHGRATPFILGFLMVLGTSIGVQGSNIFFPVGQLCHSSAKYSGVSFCDSSFYDDLLLWPLSSWTEHFWLVVHQCRNWSVLSVLSALQALFQCACVFSFSILVHFF